MSWLRKTVDKEGPCSSQKVVEEVKYEIFFFYFLTIPQTSVLVFKFIVKLFKIVLMLIFN